MVFMDVAYSRSKFLKTLLLSIFIYFVEILSNLKWYYIEIISIIYIYGLTIANRG